MGVSYTPCPPSCGGDPTQLISHRGGGAEAGDLLTDRLAATDCLRLCTYGMMFGCLIEPWATLPDYAAAHAHYLKCYDASSPTPLNNRRIQFPSQLNTPYLDPTLPKMNITDWKAFLRML